MYVLPRKNKQRQPHTKIINEVDLIMSSISSASAIANSNTNPNKHSTSISSTNLGGASGITILLGNHAKFGLAERCW